MPVVLFFPRRIAVYAPGGKVLFDQRSSAVKTIEAIHGPTMSLVEGLQGPLADFLKASQPALSEAARVVEAGTFRIVMTNGKIYNFETQDVTPENPMGQQILKRLKQ